uniref:Uncharacterized protein n=1 Tax=Arundo donax TaxID=35708 RepID=A0A0A8ZXN2_ARUDO
MLVASFDLHAWDQDAFGFFSDVARWKRNFLITNFPKKI